RLLVRISEGVEVWLPIGAARWRSKPPVPYSVELASDNNFEPGRKLKLPESRASPPDPEPVSPAYAKAAAELLLDVDRRDKLLSVTACPPASLMEPPD